MWPMAYHITWTAYGTWLHGDPRGWVFSGQPCVLPPDNVLHLQMQSRLVECAVLFDESQRRILEQTIDDHCRIRGWRLHARNARSNHVHLVVTAERKPEDVMDQLKAWCSRRLSDAAGLIHDGRAKNAGRRKWFTEHGSTNWIDDDEYFQNAIRYVTEGQ